MEEKKRAKELSFQWPHHAVDLVERAAEVDGAIICVSRQEFKTFIALKVFQEFWRRNPGAGKMVLLVDDEKAKILKSFMSGAANQSTFLVKTCFNETDFTDDRQCDLSNCDIMITTGKIFMQILKAGKTDLTFFSLIIFDKCHLAIDKDHPFAIILKQVDECELHLKPQIVGLSAGILHHQACPEDLETFFTSLEEAFHCKALISSDLLAVNRYGEQADVEISCYASTLVQSQDQVIGKLNDILQSAVVFLRDYRVCEETQSCVKFIKHILIESHKVLLWLGQWSTASVAKVILKEIKKLEKKCNEDSNCLLLQFCRTQMNLIINLSGQEIVESPESNLTDLTRKLLVHMSAHLKLEDKVVDTDDTLSSNPDQPSKELSSSTNAKTSYGTNKQCNDPLCVVLVPSTIIAKALNSLINKLSKTVPEYSFLRSACAHGNKTNQGISEESLLGGMEDNVMECVQDGSVNVLVATFEIEKELYARRCSLLIRLGVPKDYGNYFRVKSKLKTAGAKLVVLVREEEMTKAEEKYKVFQRIEQLLKERCPNSRPPCHEIMKLFQNDTLEAYEPYRERGPRVDLLSSISLVNSYCAKFPSSGAGAPVLVCRRKEVRSDNEVQFVSVLYLPRNSPVYQPIKGSVALKRNEVDENTARKARIKSEMVAALEACRRLHEKGELSDELQPVLRFSVPHLAAEGEICDCEVADSGVGVDGSVKRNRAYKRKFPSILENNFPVCGEPSYVYCVDMELTKAWSFERAVRSQSKIQSTSVTHCLGIISRKPLPKLPGMLLFDRAGEVTATVTECSAHPVVLTSDQVLLLQRFTGYVFREIAKPKKHSSSTFPTFDPSIATSGYYISLLKDVPDSCCSQSNATQQRKEIAFDFMHLIEDALGSFNNPTDPPPPGIKDPEIFRDTVVTAIYQEKQTHYYVADICYDRSPADPFPNPELASTFAEYFQKRYAVEVCLEQPMLDVDHTSSRLNFLIPRYQNVKGQNLSVPEKDSKRTQKSMIFVIPELCSIHPVPGYLWRKFFILPALLYRMESLLVAEELRSHIACALGMGAVDWPSDVPLPLLTMGEMVGEEIVRKEDPVTGMLSEKSSSKEAAKKCSSLQCAELSESLMSLQISRQEEHNTNHPADSLPLQDSDTHPTTHSFSNIICDKTLVEGSRAEAVDRISLLPASNGVSLNSSETEAGSSQSEVLDSSASIPLDKAMHGGNSKPVVEMDSERSSQSEVLDSSASVPLNKVMLGDNTKPVVEMDSELGSSQSELFDTNASVPLDKVMLGDNSKPVLEMDSELGSSQSELLDSSVSIPLDKVMLGGKPVLEMNSELGSSQSELLDSNASVPLEKRELPGDNKSVLEIDSELGSPRSELRNAPVPLDKEMREDNSKSVLEMDSELNSSQSELVDTNASVSLDKGELPGDNSKSVLEIDSELGSSQSELVNTNASVPLDKRELPEDNSKSLLEMDNELSPVAVLADPLSSGLYQTCGPPSTLILRALTTSMSGDVFNLERLEILGDSFLKYAITCSVFFQYRYENEGKLSFMRGLRVSNRQLFYLARQRGLPSYMITRMFNPLVNWLPPGFYYRDGGDTEQSGEEPLLLIPDKGPQELDDDEEENSIFAGVESPDPGVVPHSQDPSSEGQSSDIQLSHYLHLCCSDKAIADATEALVGAYLLCLGPEAAFKFLEWLGVELAKQKESEDECKTSSASEGSKVNVESSAVINNQDNSKVPFQACESFDCSSIPSEETCIPDSSMTESGSRSTAATINNLDDSKVPFQACEVFDRGSFPAEETDVPNPSMSESSLRSTATTINSLDDSNVLFQACEAFDCSSFPSEETDVPNPSMSESSLRSTAAEFKSLEEALNYHFRDKTLLVQAFTHTSLPRDYNSVRSSYEQLELLGDALLDFLVTRHLYRYHGHMPPGELTDLRSAVVNNYSFSALAVQLDFPKHLRAMSPQVFSMVNKFAVKLKEKQMKQQQVESDEIYSSVFIMGSEGDQDGIQVEVPKALGDLFEAVAGAIYLDCRQDLDRVWQVYLPILKPSFDYYSAHPPMSATRRLLEMMPNAVKFSPVERMVDGKFRCTLAVSGCGQFVAKGRNFRIAKSIAAQRALSAVQKKNSETKKGVSS